MNQTKYIWYWNLKQYETLLGIAFHIGKIKQMPFFFFAMCHKEGKNNKKENNKKEMLNDKSICNILKLAMKNYLNKKCKQSNSQNLLYRTF